jgi:hypothetical protein
LYDQAETTVITDPIATNHTAMEEGPSLDDQMEEQVLADD